MEMPLSDFVPVTEGGDLPMHRIWYVRSGDKVLWDRRRKLDLVFGSGMTKVILATGGDDVAAEETARRISEASANLEKLEEERQHRLEVQLHAQRHAEARAAGRLPGPSTDRSALVQALFKLCDTDGDKALSADEMHI